MAVLHFSKQRRSVCVSRREISKFETCTRFN
jgi:hypothetical protein